MLLGLLDNSLLTGFSSIQRNPHALCQQDNKKRMNNSLLLLGRRKMCSHYSNKDARLTERVVFKQSLPDIFFNFLIMVTQTTIAPHKPNKPVDNSNNCCSILLLFVTFKVRQGAISSLTLIQLSYQRVDFRNIFHKKSKKLAKSATKGNVDWCTRNSGT